MSWQSTRPVGLGPNLAKLSSGANSQVHAASSREGIDHQGDQRPVAQAHRGARGDRIKQIAGFFSCQRGRLALLERMLRPAHGAGRVGGDNLAHHKPVEEHADRGQLEFDRRSRQAALQLLDIGGDMEWLDVAEMGDADGVRPSGEAADGGGVGLAGVRVPDVGGEELEDRAGRWPSRERTGRGAGYRRPGEFPVLGLRSWESVSGSRA